MDDLDCNSFYDHIDDLLVDFSGDDVVSDHAKPHEPSSFPSLWSTHSDSLPNSDSVFSDHSDLSAEISVPYEDIVQLEWLSNFVEDSFSGGESLTIGKEQFETSSPVSVLESSSSTSSGGGGEKITSRARSKRPRPPTFNPRPPIKLIISSSSSDNNNSFAESPSSPEMIKIPKKKKIRLSVPPVVENSVSVRKCMHCEITKTPQWRAGPMGPKTLCNACGVRFKSGRLYPEYRPAASPTFVPSIHSNSHKKVIEMRGRVVGPVNEIAPELIPNPNTLN